MPFIIEKIIAFGLLYATVFFLIFAGGGRRGEPWRAVVELVFQMVPILGKAQRYLALSRLTAALEASTSAGVPIIRGWEMSAAASGSPRLRRVISTWKEPLASGATPGELVNQSSCFPEMFANLYNTGEQSGQMDDTLSRLHTYYQEEGFRTLRLFTRIMNGTIYGAVVILVAYSVISFYVGYFKAAFEF
jgi:type II secretory pathway component PulF